MKIITVNQRLHPPKTWLKIMLFVLLLIFIAGCNSNAPYTPEGTRVPWDDWEPLFDFLSFATGAKASSGSVYLFLWQLHFYPDSG